MIKQSPFTRKKKKKKKKIKTKALQFLYLREFEKIVLSEIWC